MPHPTKGAAQRTWGIHNVDFPNPCQATNRWPDPLPRGDGTPSSRAQPRAGPANTLVSWHQITLLVSGQATTRWPADPLPRGDGKPSRRAQPGAAQRTWRILKSIFAAVPNHHLVAANPLPRVDGKLSCCTHLGAAKRTRFSSFVPNALLTALAKSASRMSAIFLLPFSASSIDEPSTTRG